MNNEKLFNIPFSKIYDLYLAKAERKQRSKTEVNLLICWLTGYDEGKLMDQIEQGVSLKLFFDEAPHIHDHAALITGLICGVRIEDIEDPLMKKIRYMDKLIDELAKGKSIDKILR